jgi:hypothetical protein
MFALGIAWNSIIASLNTISAVGYVRVAISSEDTNLNLCRKVKASQKNAAK